MNQPIVFPVKVPYVVAADISKYQGEAHNINPNATYLDQKRLEINRFGMDLCASGSGTEAVMPTIADYLRKPVKDIKTLALEMEEDIAVLHKGILASICFCFPSGFIPSQKIGMTFMEMHNPVADADRLLSASDKLTALISKEGNVFRRYVWTLTTLPELSQHPALPRPQPIRVEDVYFRTETQTTIGLANNVCLFLVKVEMQPLSVIWDDATRKKILRDSINSMGDATLTYKKLHQIKQILNESCATEFKLP